MTVSDEQVETYLGARTTAEKIDAILDTLTTKQLEFVHARLYTDTDKKAAESIGITGNAVSKWKSEGAQIDEVIRLKQKDTVELALDAFRDASLDAAEEIISQLQHKSAQQRLLAAREILDRGIGKAVQKTENQNNTELVWRFVNDWRNPTADAPSWTEGNPVGEETLQLVSGGSPVEEDDFMGSAGD